MFSTIAITDFDWYKFLLNEQDIGEVNFWTPSARRTFRGEPFSPFLFKLRAPHNAICGFGYFAQYSTLPDWLAWECFEVGNGCRSLKEMRQRIQQIRARIRYRQSGPLNEIGCRLIVEPTFFPQEAWVAQPRDGSARTQTTKKYDLSRGEGYRVWQECLAQAEYLSSNHMEDALVVQESQRRCGKPQEISPRLGQGTFRIAVTDAYNRGCAVTDEHSLPALEATHIQPYSENGPHDVRNGLLLRADLHRLFDQGYMTVSTDFRVEISQRLRDHYHNGHTYYPLHGQTLRISTTKQERPAAEFLRWHNERTFLS